MRRLLILRHARAVPGQGVADYDRALTGSGESDAAEIGDYIAAAGMTTDLVVYSGARRTRDTALIVAGRWSQPTRMHEALALYEATRHLIQLLLRELPDSAASVLIVGHNPGVSDIANWLAGEGDPLARLKMAARFPTCGLAALDFDAASWSGLDRGLGRLDRFVTPADLETR